MGIYDYTTQPPALPGIGGQSQQGFLSSLQNFGPQSFDPNAAFNSLGISDTLNPAPTIPTTGPPEGGGGIFGNLFQGGENGGASKFSQGLSAFTGLSSAYLGLKQYGLAKDSFKQNRKEFNLNFDANRKLTNSRLEDRQRARVASNPGAYESVGSYLDKNAVSARG